MELVCFVSQTAVSSCTLHITQQFDTKYVHPPTAYAQEQLHAL